MKRQSELATGAKPLTSAAAALVYAHAGIVMVHGAAHARLRVPLSTWAGVFVAVVIGIAPFLALVLLMYGKWFQGVGILAASMVASFLFGVWNHFAIPGGDHVAHISNGPWRLPFQITAGLLVVTEGIGSMLALPLLRVRLARRPE